MAWRFTARSETPGAYAFRTDALEALANYPAESDVWHGVTYGSASEKVGTKRASSIPNLVAENVRLDVIVDDVTGTCPAYVPAVTPVGLSKETTEYLLRYGEEVIYIPRSGDSRTIRAVVVRESIASEMTGFSAPTPVITVWVANDSTYGISASELDRGGDKISVAVKPGAQSTELAIVSTTIQDGDMIAIEVR